MANRARSHALRLVIVAAAAGALLISCRPGPKPRAGQTAALPNSPATPPAAPRSAQPPSAPPAPPEPLVIRKAKRKINAGGENVYLTVFAPEGRYALSLEHNLTVVDSQRTVSGTRWRLIDLEQGEGVMDSPPISCEVTQASLSADGRRAFLSGIEIHGAGSAHRPSAYLAVWDLERVQTLDSPTPLHSMGRTFAPVLSEDGGLVANICTVPSEGSFIEVLDVGAAQRFVTPMDETGSPTTLALSPDGKRLASGGWEWYEFLRVWPVRTSQRPVILPITGPIWSLAWSRDGRYLAAAQSNMVRVWDFDKRAELRRMRCHGPIDGLAFSPHGRQMLSSTRGHADDPARAPREQSQQKLQRATDAAVWLWDLESGRQIARIEPPRAARMNVCFSADGRQAFTGGDDGVIRAWDLPKEQATNAARVGEGTPAVEIPRVGSQR